MSDVQEVAAEDIQVGDELETEGGAFVRVGGIKEARWIKDVSNRPLLEFLADRHDRYGFLIGRSDRVRRKVA